MIKKKKIIKMNKEKAIKILKIEKECVIRADKNKCNRQCELCDLVMPAQDILNAYDYFIKNNK